MIKFENTQTYGWDAAIRGMRNPMNSWDKSDTRIECPDEGTTRWCGDPIIGPNDLKLIKSLIKAGSDHSKFMRMINVSVDITAPLYWWKEFDTYKVGTVRNSCSTMHKIMSKEFTIDDFSFNIVGNDYKKEVIEYILDELNNLRDTYLTVTTDKAKKDIWYSVIELLPSAYNQRATIQMNYAVLRNMYRARKCHKLDEWSVGFCEWVESLPYSELITEDFKGDTEDET